MGARGWRATGHRKADLRRPGSLRSWPGPAREKEAARAAVSACGKEGLVGGEKGRWVRAVQGRGQTNVMGEGGFQT